MGFDIEQARPAEDLIEIGHLIRIYVEWLVLNLSFQGFEAEINDLASNYNVLETRWLLPKMK